MLSYSRDASYVHDFDQNENTWIKLGNLRIARGTNIENLSVLQNPEADNDYRLIPKRRFTPRDPTLD